MIFKREKICRLTQPCPKCGSQYGIIRTNLPPHLGRLDCADCGRWLRWIGKDDLQLAKFWGLVN